MVIREWIKVDGQWLMVGLSRFSVSRTSVLLFSILFIAKRAPRRNTGAIKRGNKKTCDWESRKTKTNRCQLYSGVSGIKLAISVSLYGPFPLHASLNLLLRLEKHIWIMCDQPTKKQIKGDEVEKDRPPSRQIWKPPTDLRMTFE